MNKSLHWVATQGVFGLLSTDLCCGTLAKIGEDMKREPYIEEGKENFSKTSSKQNSQAVTKGNVERYVRRDSAGRFVESANEHMLRAWKLINRKGRRERRSS